MYGLMLPGVWQIFLLALAPIIGLVAGAILRNVKHPILLSAGISLLYAFCVVQVAFLYQQIAVPGHYDAIGWLILVIPLFLYAYPVVGLTWAGARYAARVFTGDA
jgi:hypothetical protein